MPREKLFSVRGKDCEFQVFRAGGKGGQNQNKVSSAVRCIHHPSGAVGESREHREQLQNKRKAFERMAKSPKMQAWIRVMVARITGREAAIKEEVDRLMNPRHMVVEGKKNGRWVPIEEAVVDE